MDMKKIVETIPLVIKELTTEYTIGNGVIKDDIFKILEKHCTVFYYPLKNETNRGFHTKRFVKDKLEDFVFINTDKPIADQIFAAAHELGHVWNVVDKIKNRLSSDDGLSFSEEELKICEEDIINKFAAELLMPKKIFFNTFSDHVKELGLDPHRFKLIDLIQIIVLQMNDYMVPYESVRRRLIETGIISEDVGDILKKNADVVLKTVSLLTGEQNSVFDRITGKKTVPGLRSMIEQIEKDKKLDEYTIAKIKKDFAIDKISDDLDELITIKAGD